MVGEGLEPPKLITPDLQSGPFAALVTHHFSLTTTTLTESVGLAETKAEGIEPPSTDLESVILPLNYANVIVTQTVSLRTHGVGFEPTSDKLTVWGITIMLPVFIMYFFMTI